MALAASKHFEVSLGGILKVHCYSVQCVGGEQVVIGNQSELENLAVER